MDGCNAIRVASINPPFLYGHQLIQPTTQLNNTFLHILGVLGVRYIVRLWYWLTHSLTDAMDGWMDGPFDIGSSRSFHCRVVSYWVCCVVGWAIHNSQTPQLFIYWHPPSIHPSDGMEQLSQVELLRSPYPHMITPSAIIINNNTLNTEHYYPGPGVMAVSAHDRPPAESYRRLYNVGWGGGWMDALLYAHTHTQSDSLSSNISISLLPHSSSSFQTFELIELCRCGSLLRWTAQKEGRAQLISAAAAAAATRSTEHKSRRLNLLLALFSSLSQPSRTKERK